MTAIGNAIFVRTEHEKNIKCLFGGIKKNVSDKGRAFLGDLNIPNFFKSVGTFLKFLLCLHLK